MTQSFPPPAFDLPEALLSQGYSLRPETDADLPFLMQVYTSTRIDELTTVPWDDDQKRAFLIHQFGAQRTHYYAHFMDGGAFLIIERNGKPVGRLYLQEVVTRIHLIDIVMMPDQRNGGVGSAIIVALQDYARRRGKGVDNFVERYNPALNLYRRLGFEVVREEEVYLEMDWAPEGVS